MQYTNLKSGKALSQDGVRLEKLKVEGNEIPHIKSYILQDIWTLCEGLEKGVNIRLTKKRDIGDCNNSGITLLFLTSKVFSRVI